MDESSTLRPYTTTAIEALSLLKVAMGEAKALLPQKILTRHWMAGHFSPAAWKSAEEWLRNQDTYDPHVLEILTDLALLAQALACLTTVTVERKPMGSLKLAKTRHVEI